MHTVYDRVVIAIKLINFQADSLVAKVHAISAKYHSSIHRRTYDHQSFKIYEVKYADVKVSIN